MVSAGTAGLLLAGVFGGILWSVRQSELRSVDQLLATALHQARQETSADPNHPDLAEIADSDPELSIVAYDPSGGLIQRIGSLPLHFQTPVGKGVLDNGAKAIVARATVDGVRLLAAIPWKSRDEYVEHLFWLLALIWAPLTAFAAGATWLASRSTFRPLGELARQAAAMSETSLSDRLSVSDGDEYAKFATQLNGFLDRLEGSVRQQERFVADAAHELRTPLAVLRGSLEASLNRPRRDEEYREVIRTSLSEVDRLSSLIEVLLRSAAPQVESPPPIDLEAAIEQAHSRWVDRFASCGVTLDLDIVPASAAIGEMEIGVLVDNLLSNALRVSGPDSLCHVSLKPLASGGSRIAIEDEGPGVPEEFCERIFERFARGDYARNRGLGGFGIGLSVCQRLVAARGGSIRVEDGDKGARFVIELPDH